MDKEKKDNSEYQRKKKRYFGTDGMRGEANTELTVMHAFAIGSFLGRHYGHHTKIENESKDNSAKKAKFIVGRDTRLSSPMLECGILAGLTSSGADAARAGIVTTPALSYLTREGDFDGGIMITASHNPYYDNGIKIFDRLGEKLSDSVTSSLEDYIDEFLETDPKNSLLAAGKMIGKIHEYDMGSEKYKKLLISSVNHPLTGMKIGVDCANGSTYKAATEIFSYLGAEVMCIGCAPDGININRNVGSTHIETLRELVFANNLDMGFAFDGDGDRCIAVDKGGIIDGDKALYILAKDLAASGELHKNTVVSTIMSNMGLKKALEESGIRTETTAVGDRFVFERMNECGYSLGGEQSGHIIIKKHMPTGDGILTALQLSEISLKTKKTLSELSKNVKPLPQITRNLKIENKDFVMGDQKTEKFIETIKKEIGDKGRILIRKSGTENLIRVMAEHENADKCKYYVDIIADFLLKAGKSNEQ